MQLTVNVARNTCRRCRCHQHLKQAPDRLVQKRDIGRRRPDAGPLQVVQLGQLVHIHRTLQRHQLLAHVQRAKAARPEAPAQVVHDDGRRVHQRWVIAI